MDIHTTLFDTWQPGTTAYATADLFQVAQGGDSAHNERFTNMRGAGQLPAGEKFEVRKIALMLDENLTEADLAEDLFGALIEIKIKDKLVFSCPARRLFAYSDYAGHFTQATAASRTLIGPSGQPFTLDIPLTIPGGTRFVVRAVQGTALAETRDIKVILEGVLSLPD